MWKGQSMWNLIPARVIKFARKGITMTDSAVRNLWSLMCYSFIFFIRNLSVFPFSKNESFLSHENTRLLQAY